MPFSITSTRELIPRTWVTELMASAVETCTPGTVSSTCSILVAPMRLMSSALMTVATAGARLTGLA
jgi:hypothetical protein